MCTRISVQSPIVWAIPLATATVVPVLAERIQQLGMNIFKPEDSVHKMLTVLSDEKHFSLLLGCFLMLPASIVAVHTLYQLRVDCQPQKKE